MNSSRIIGILFLLLGLGSALYCETAPVPAASNPSIAEDANNVLCITTPQGISQNFDYDLLRQIPRQEVKTTKMRDGSIILWQGFRFDNWLKDNGFTSFEQIKLQAPDLYQVAISGSDLASLEAWMVFGREGEELADDEVRILFPGLREMNWLRNPVRVMLENEIKLPLPKSFLLMSKALGELKLAQDPPPFVNIRGNFFADLHQAYFPAGAQHYLILTKDDLKSILDYPAHLQKAVLEHKADGSYSMKSPQIPGGMWLNEISYIQAGETALITEDGMGELIGIAKRLNWELNPDSMVYFVTQSGVLSLPLDKFISNKEIFGTIISFSIR